MAKKNDATWTNSNNIMAAIEAAHRRLCDGTSTVEQARAEACLFNVGAKMLHLQYEHAKATKRLHEGDDNLPGFQMK